MQVYLVGGAVRDKLMGRVPQEKDWLVVGSTPEEMLAKGFRPVGRDFPVFLHPETQEEYALARSERKSGRGYRGFVFHTSPDVTIEEDLRRRDLTINAMAEDENANLIDPYGGLEDLKQKILRHVSLAFVEDPVRILRVARFAARFIDFNVHNETQDLMQKMVQNGEVDALVPERVMQEMLKALSEKKPSRFFEVLKNAGALNKLFPLLEEINYALLDKAAEKNCSVHVVFALLFYTFTPLQFKEFLKKYIISNEDKELVITLIKLHRAYFHLDIADADAIYDFILRADALRKMTRFFYILDCCEMIYGNALKASLLKRVAQELKDTRFVLPAGVVGKAAAGYLRQERVKLIEGLLG